MLLLVSLWGLRAPSRQANPGGVFHGLVRKNHIKLTESVALLS